MLKFVLFHYFYHKETATNLIQTRCRQCLKKNAKRNHETCFNQKELDFDSMDKTENFEYSEVEELKLLKQLNKK